jgi:hypothetical protein
VPGRAQLLLTAAPKPDGHVCCLCPSVPHLPTLAGLVMLRAVGWWGGLPQGFLSSLGLGISSRDTTSALTGRFIRDRKSCLAVTAEGLFFLCQKEGWRFSSSPSTRSAPAAAYPWPTCETA